MKLKTKDPATTGAPPTKFLTTDVSKTSKLPKCQPNLAQKIKSSRLKTERLSRIQMKGRKKGLTRNVRNDPLIVNLQAQESPLIASKTIERQNWFRSLQRDWKATTPLPLIKPRGLDAPMPSK